MELEQTAETPKPTTGDVTAVLPYRRELRQSVREQMEKIPPSRAGVQQAPVFASAWPPAPQSEPASARSRNTVHLAREVQDRACQSACLLAYRLQGCVLAAMGPPCGHIANLCLGEGFPGIGTPRSKLGSSAVGIFRYAVR